jgi:hypothetical protein
MSARNPQITDKQSTALGFLARFWWMLIGNVVLALSLIFIYHNEGGFFHPADGVFWVTVATLVIVRYLDIKYLDGQTATGTHASIRNWVVYVILLIACSTVAWGIAHVANHLSAGNV